MITRQQAQDQANACFMYNLGGFVATAVGAALTGSRAATGLAEAWGLGVAAHAALLYGVPQTREKILMWTASGMEDLQRLHHSSP